MKSSPPGSKVFHGRINGNEEKVKRQWVTRFDIRDIQHCQESYLERSLQHPKLDCAQHLNCRGLDDRVTIYWLVYAGVPAQTFRSNFIVTILDVLCASILTTAAVFGVYSSTAGYGDARLCQWGGVNGHRLAIQPLIHNRGRNLH